MNDNQLLRCAVTTERWPYHTPFRIARGVETELGVIVVRLTDARGQTGWGEASGVDYEGESLASMIAQIDQVRRGLTDGLTRAALQDLLPAGGARNAVDCALWDLEAKTSGIPAWRTAGLDQVGPVTTAMTIGIGSDAEVRTKARAIRDWPLIKMKADAVSHLGPVRIAHEECPSARFIVDANQSWTVDLLNQLGPELAALNVALIEQPVKKGTDRQLAGYTGTIPLAADESCVDRSSLPGLVGLYHVVNIKLDKTGGLTEALALAADARARGLGIMIGCMAGTSLAMAPGAVIAQQAQFIDLDGPLLHSSDRPNGLRYERGVMSFPTPALWG
ncbi:MAG: dipeptide epimerase [Gemmatimonadetes bacterium]|nr:dipeptide epimerase [Gemmatimonadota bacterium]